MSTVTPSSLTSTSPETPDAPARGASTQIPAFPLRSVPLLKEEIAELIVGRNQDGIGQTYVEHLNGSSAAVSIDLSNYLPTPAPAAHSGMLSAMPRSFHAVQKWEGYVLEVLKDTFLARLSPILGEGRDQDAEIFLNQVHQDDRALVEPGAVFYWSIGHAYHRSGKVTQESVLRFRRLPGWTRRELVLAEAEADEIESLFEDE
jgi:hypothetical protein